ncbi:MAG: ATP-binding protein, partial [Pelovirga sp.]
YGITDNNPHIDIGLESGPEPVFYIRDYGPGIPIEFHQKIFGLFEKLDRNSKGSGLGLALVKRIVARHGGKIWVESSGKGKGCCFKFTLPAACIHQTTTESKPL